MSGMRTTRRSTAQGSPKNALWEAEGSFPTVKCLPFFASVWFFGCLRFGQTGPGHRSQSDSLGLHNNISRPGLEILFCNQSDSLGLHNNISRPGRELEAPPIRIRLTA